LLNVAALVTPRVPLSVVLPVTPRVPPTVVLLVIEALFNVAKPDVVIVERDVLPVTDRVEPNVVAPVIPTVPPIVVAPVPMVKVFVPRTEVFPLRETLPVPVEREPEPEIVKLPDDCA